jgi:hypothetical protein
MLLLLLLVLLPLLTKLLLLCRHLPQLLHQRPPVFRHGSYQLSRELLITTSYIATTAAASSSNATASYTPTATYTALTRRPTTQAASGRSTHTFFSSKSIYPTIASFSAVDLSSSCFTSGMLACLPAAAVCLRSSTSWRCYHKTH